MRTERLILIAALTLAAGYGALVLCEALFKVDFRFWVLGLRPIDGRHVAPFRAYLIPFGLAFSVTTRALLSNLAVQGERAAVQYAVAALAMSAGFVVLLAVQYGGLFLTGVLVSPKEALNVIIAIQFVPLLGVVGLISAFTWRRTNSSETCAT